MCLETCIRCFTGQKPKTLAKGLPWVEYWYNTSYHSAIEMTPFKALYERDPPKLICFYDTPMTNASVEEMLRERDALLKELRAHILKAQQRMKRSGDKHHRDLAFSPGRLGLHQAVSL